MLLLLKEHGTTFVHYVYDAYGNIIKTDVTSGYAHRAAINSYTCRGYRYDSEIGMVNLNSRYYNPEIGRFINSDGLLGQKVIYLLQKCMLMQSIIQS